MSPNLETLVSLACRFEPIAREHGYHVAITGSALYGKEVKGEFELSRCGEVEDCDILVYEHNGFNEDARLDAPELMEKFGVAFEQTSGDYDECCVFKVTENGLKMDFMFL